jgi:hypothetical protein
MSQAEPTRAEQERWYQVARDVAKMFTSNSYWISEYQSIGVVHLSRVWHKYAHLDEKSRSKLIWTILKRVILHAHTYQRKIDLPLSSLGNGPEEDEHQTSSDVLEAQMLDFQGGEDSMRAVEDEYDYNVEFGPFFSSLSPSQRRVILEDMQNPGATSDEIAVWANVESGLAARQHKVKGKGKLERMIREHPEDQKLQRYLADDRSKRLKRKRRV